MTPQEISVIAAAREFALTISEFNKACKDFDQLLIDATSPEHSLDNVNIFNVNLDNARTILNKAKQDHEIATLNLIEAVNIDLETDDQIDSSPIPCPICIGRKSF